MGLSRFIAFFGAVAIGCLIACENPAPPAFAGMAGQGGMPTAGVTSGSSGSVAAASGGAGAPAVAGMTASASGGAGAGAGGAGTTAAGAGASGMTAATAGAGAGASGQAGAAAGSGGSAGAAGNAVAGASGQMSDAGVAPEDDDPLGDLFPPASCDGLLCIADGDCASLYPEQAATCKLTKCVDFACQ